jgi:hypothetical protein
MVPGGGTGTPDATRLPVSMGKSHAHSGFRMTPENLLRCETGKFHPSIPRMLVQSSTTSDPANPSDLTPFPRLR